MSSGILVGEAIKSILTGDTQVHSYVQEKIYTIFAPDLTQSPFIVYYTKLSLTDYNYCKNGLIYDDCVVTIHCISKSSKESLNIANAVRNALELKHGIFEGVTIEYCYLNSVEQNYGVDGFITTLIFDIRCE